MSTEPRRAPSPLRRAVRAAALLALAGAAGGCVPYRLVRHGYLAPDRQERVFARRVVHRADRPFRFARAPERTDLDTITVRSSDGRSVSWAEYMRVARVRAFLVVRQDTILYERYLDGYTDSTRSGSYSMAKAFTSALLGIALGDSAVRSLDDSVTRYVPELARNPTWTGVTLRHALEMRTGTAYERASGSTWHDLRSDDARYYYTGHLDRALAAARRVEPPGGRWAYRDSDAQLIALVLARATSRPLAEQLERRVWRRIGTEFDASWSLDRTGGSEKAATGVNATARDYARFGRLFLHGGAWEGEQLVPRDWVERSTTLDTTRTRPEVGTWWRMQHRTYWWIPMRDWARERDFFADGAKGQRLYVHRPSGTIIVQLADSDEQDFPFRRITHYLLGEPYAYPVHR
ncbi:MAG TPA: serine hydrolase [Gemmatirosa sp.]|nr:serine hydrolase [Gemmatirosa sp.]